MVFGILVDFPPTFPQAVENRVEKAEFYTRHGENFHRISQNSHKIRIFRPIDLPKSPVYMWKTKNQLCEQPKFSESNPHDSVESHPRFSTEKIPKNFHNDIFRGPYDRQKPIFGRFRLKRAGFPKNIHTISPAEPQEIFGRRFEKSLSLNDIFTFHSFHPLYKYYCWYSYVFLGILSR